MVTHLQAQTLLYIPDGVAMLVLMAVLVYLRGQSRVRDATVWLVGLSFILFEALASDAYRANLGLRRVTHSVALAMFVLAAFTFGWAIVKDRGQRRASLAFGLAGAIPLLVIAFVYGFGRTGFALYGGVAIVGLVAQVGCTARFLRGWRWILLAIVVELAWWLPMVAFARAGFWRGVIYWGLGVAYLLVAVAMGGMVRRSQVGGALVVAGFAVWSACLLAHPYVRAESVGGRLVDQIWTMQKFVVTIGLLLVMLDEERRANRELALIDELTGLPNRRLLDDRLQQSIERSNRYGASFALFVIDLDGFKAINDRLGHDEGDQVLKAAAARLLGVVRSSDTLARCGGDEFVVLVNELDAKRCELLCGQFRTALSGGGKAEPVAVPLSGSVGFALYPADARDGKSLMQCADRRMYEQKALRGAVSGGRWVAQPR